MKKTTAILISVLLGIILIVLIGFLLASTSEDRAKKKLYNNTQKEAAEVSDKEKKDFINIDVDKYLKLYDGKKASVVLISKSDCAFCQIAEPILHGIAYTYDLDINFLSTDGFSDDDKTNLLNSDAYFKEKEGMPTPLLLVVKNSKIVDKVEGLADKAGYIEFFKENKII